MERLGIGADTAIQAGTASGGVEDPARHAEATFDGQVPVAAGGLPEPFDKDFPGLNAKANQELLLLWIACGTEDRLITANRNLQGWLKSQGINHIPIETPGQHTWMVWRRNLAEFAGLLFQHAMGGSGSH